MFLLKLPAGWSVHHLICILILIILLFSDVLIIFNKTLDLKKNTHIAAR